MDIAIDATGVAFETAALAEPMGCVLNGVEAIWTEGADEALVCGAGPIGVLMALRTRGVASIGLVDINEGRLELAASFGFSAASRRFSQGSQRPPC